MREDILLGKVPPQSIEAEEMVIGSCLVDSDVAIDIVSLLQPEMFYKEVHKHIYEAIVGCLRTTNYCDLVVVTDYLKKKGLLECIGGPVYITQLSSHIAYSGNAVNMALIVKEKYLLREYIRIGYELVNKAFEGDVSEASEFAESEIYKLSEATKRGDFSHISQSIDEVLIEVDRIMRKEISVVGVASGFTSLDRITSGWQNGDLVIVAGRPSMGKTAMALELVRGAAELGCPSGVFSLEMSKKQLASRYLSGASVYSNK